MPFIPSAAGELLVSCAGCDRPIDTVTEGHYVAAVDGRIYETKCWTAPGPDGGPPIGLLNARAVLAWTKETATP